MASNLYDLNGVALEDEHGDITLAKGTTVPTDATSGYAVGCLFMDTDAIDGGVLFINEGTNSSCDFNSVSSSATQNLTPAADSGTGSTIRSGIQGVSVGTVTTNVNDWIVLPSLSTVPVGFTIKIACNAGGAFEMRTPTTSGEKINTVDSDGTQEYLCTDTETITITKVSDTDGWVATGQTALGAIATAVVPD